MSAASAHPDPVLGIDIATRAAALGLAGDANATGGTDAFAALPHATGGAETLATLAHALAHELAAWRERPLPVPGKARLTRRGGRCERDGTPLRFDPRAPDAHRCPRCDATWHDHTHHDWWAMGAHLFTVERAVHGALLAALGVAPWGRALAATTLHRLADAYATWPCRDNVLGPSRPFFSTYLESVWLLNGCVAASLLGDDPAAERWRTEVLAPSRTLVAAFPEGIGNRAAWRTAALLAAARLAGEAATVDALVFGDEGLVALLRRGLLDDGSWWEGENYHLFAHRGLWYGVTIARAAGIALPADAVARYRRGFVAPFRTVLPDGTWPARRDSRYRSPVAQWRTREWLELGWAESADPDIAAWITRMAAWHPADHDGARVHDGGDGASGAARDPEATSPADAPGGPRPRDTGRWRSTADIEQDEPAGAVPRSALSWRALVAAAITPPPPTASRARSAMLPAQGVAVLRRDAGRMHVALETGGTIGGHGHPDTLGLVVQDGALRLQEDPGTGSYVDPSLHWYRSTLAHGAPLVDGRSQRGWRARCTAFEARGGVGWVRAAADAGDAACTQLVRTVVLLDTHVVDVLDWRAAMRVRVELPVHVAGKARLTPQDAPPPWRSADPAGGTGLEDGFAALRDAEVTGTSIGDVLRIAVAHGAASDEATRTAPALDAGVHLLAPATTAEAQRTWWWRAVAPGPPGFAPRRMYWVRQEGRAGRMVAVWSVRGDVRAVHVEADAIVVALRNGTEARHRDDGDGWHVDLSVGTARSSVDLAPLADGTAPPPARAPVAPPAPASRATPLPFTALLAEPHYRRGDASWADAGRPSADVHLAWRDDGLDVVVDAHTGPPVVPPPGAENALDNERPEVNASGVQLHVGPAAVPAWSGAWLVLPDGEPARCVPLLDGLPALAARWSSTSTGWRVSARIPAALLPDGAADPAIGCRIAVCVNERPAGWERRRGQLVLSGARGGWVYLRGDRHDPADALRVVRPVAPTPSESPPPA